MFQEYPVADPNDTAYCEEGATTNQGGVSFNFKDCWASCVDEEYCNKGLDIEKMFSHPNQVESCKQCFYDEEGDSGEKNCQIGSSVSSVTCPGKFSVGLLFCVPNQNCSKCCV